MVTNLRRKLVCFVATYILSLSAIAALADQTVSNTAQIPGSDQKIDYNVTVDKIPGTRKIHLKITIRPINYGGKYSFNACGMVQTKWQQNMPNWSVGLENGCWKCKREGREDSRKSFHFGCREISVDKDFCNDPNNPNYKQWTHKDGKCDELVVFDEPSDPLDEDFDEDDLASVYWDILENHPWCTGSKEICAEVKGVNKHLGPATTDIIANNANVWAGKWTPGRCGESLKRLADEVGIRNQHCSAAHWETGNWVTMNFPGDYPARITGQIDGAPPGALFMLEVPGQFTRNYSASDNGRVPIDESFTIHRDSGKPEYDMSMFMVSEQPLTSRSNLRFFAEVLGGAGNPVYEAGQFMYSISMVSRGEPAAPPQPRSPTQNPN